MLSCCDQARRVEMLRESLEASLKLVSRQQQQISSLKTVAASPPAQPPHLTMTTGIPNKYNNDDVSTTSPMRTTPTAAAETSSSSTTSGFSPTSSSSASFPPPFVNSRPLHVVYQSGNAAVIQISGTPIKKPSPEPSFSGGSVSPSRFIVSPTLNAPRAATTTTTSMSNNNSNSLNALHIPSAPLQVIVGSKTASAKLDTCAGGNDGNVSDATASTIATAAMAAISTSPASSVDSGVISPGHSFDSATATSASPPSLEIDKFRQRSISDCLSESPLLARRKNSAAAKMEEQQKQQSSTEAQMCPSVATAAAAAATAAGNDGGANARNGCLLKGILKKPKFSVDQSSYNGQLKRSARFLMSRSLSECLTSTSPPLDIDGIRQPADNAELADALKHGLVLEDTHNGNIGNNLCASTLAEDDETESLEESSNRSDDASSEDADAKLGASLEAMELQPRKKRVSFSEHVQARIYRSSSSILGQKKKNEKKAARSKRRRSESESNASSNGSNVAEIVELKLNSASPDKMMMDDNDGTTSAVGGEELDKSMHVDHYSSVGGGGATAPKGISGSGVRRDSGIVEDVTTVPNNHHLHSHDGARNNKTLFDGGVVDASSSPPPPPSPDVESMAKRFKRFTSADSGLGIAVDESSMPIAVAVATSALLESTEV